MNDYLKLLRERPEFRYLWFAQIVSLLGDWFNTIATVILVNRYTDSGLAISFLFLARGLPPFLFGPLAGVMADRYNRRWILIISDVLRAIIVLGFLLVVSADRVWLLYVLTTLQFIVSAFFEPARAAILPSLVEEKNLLVANTLANATWSAVLSFGAVIGGVVAAIFGVQTALIIDSATFLLSAFFILRITSGGKITRQTSTSGWTDLIDGFRYVLQRPRIGVYTLVKGISNVGSVDTMFALYAASIFVVGEDGAMTLGVLYTAFGIGAVLGPVLGNRMGDGSLSFLRQWIWIGFMLLPIGWIGFSIAPFLLVAAASILIRGMGGSINWTYSSVLLQLKVPDEFLGRVFALDFSIFTLGYAISVFMTGFLVDVVEIDPRPLAMWFAVGGLVPLLFWTIIMRQPLEGTEPLPASD